MRFQQAIAELPSCCAGSFDPQRHKTPADLASMVQFEIDLFDEGDSTEIPDLSVYQLCKQYVQKWDRVARRK